MVPLVWLELTRVSEDGGCNVVMRQESERLPIDEWLPEVKAALATGRGAVIVAEPGAGKTTRVPLALLEEPWLEGRKIVMLEPRRLAARHAARYMARKLGESVGDTVGYRIRADSRVGRHTRLEVVTEGVLTRMLQEDPALSDVGLVIFDEFHERSLQADLGLALCLQARELFRDDLRLLVMSATLEAEPVAALLGGVPILTCRGRTYPVETVYFPCRGRWASSPGGGRRAAAAWEHDVVEAVLQALAEREGDALVFLPGMAEIRRVEERLREALAGRPVIVAPLHGSLPQEAQDRALAPAPEGHRKVVLSTSVAETSLTVEGVRIVIDSGWMRVAKFSPRTGMTRLETVPVSQASADQRKGRAGRTAPGVCYRLWSEEEHARLAPANAPEILEADLAALVLDLAAWGANGPDELTWLDPPPEAAWRQAKELLVTLGALDAAGRITERGRRMAALGVHPRLAHMMLAAAELGRSRIACELAVLLTERDVLHGDAARDVDIRRRVETLRGKGDQADGRLLALLREEAQALRHRLDRLREGAAQEKDGGAISGVHLETAGNRNKSDDREVSGDLDDCGILLAFAYPDRIGRRRPDGRYLLSGGRGAFLPDGQSLARAEFLAVAELDDAGADSRIRLAAPLVGDWTRALERFIRRETDVRWDAEARAVRARERLAIGAVTLRETPVPDPDPDAVAAALLAGIREEGLELLPWTRAARQFCQRARFMRRFDPSWPDFSEEGLLASLPEWLGPFVSGMRGAADLQRLDLVVALSSRLTWEQRRLLDEWAPAYLTVPSGSRVPVDYSDPEMPVLAVRLQELFGLADTPRLAGGRVPVTLHLLSPAMRPVQVTRDLAGFWRTTYAEVRKELKGRYPKHDWPDDPLAAAPSRHPRSRPR